MFWIGNAKPESSIWGRMKTNAVSIIACCWVCAMVEMKRPRPSVQSMNGNVSASSVKNEPWSGTRNRKRTTGSAVSTSTRPTSANGISLPTIRCPGVRGVTRSCSIVPSSVSRTSAIAVSIIVITMMIIESVAGTM